jgi:bla regulator protein BlaR1
MELQTAIYTTLLHSLWMGLVLSLITSLIIVSTRKQSAARRYDLLAGTLLIFVLSIAFVFYQTLNNGLKIESVSTLSSAQHVSNVIQVNPVVGNSYINSAESIISFWASYSNQIVLIWFLIICAKSIQLFIGLQSIRHIKSTNVYSAGTFWEQKVADVARKLNINKPVLILQSGLAKVPMIFGHFKPVILIPLGLLNGLAEKEVEAIISHELAHLKRNDYLVNIIQSFVEIIFFFNPGVLWISKLIREERENCCDDLALSCLDSKHQYIKALISVQEFSASHPNYAMAITGRKNSLKDRVSRLVFDSNSSLNKVEKTLLCIGLVSLVIISTAFTKIRSYVKENNIITVKEVTMFFGNTPQDPSKAQSIKKKSAVSAIPKSKATEVKANQQKIDSKIKEAVSNDIEYAGAADSQAQLADVRAYEEDIKEYQEEVKRYQADVARQQVDVREYQAGMVKYQKAMRKYQTDITKYAADPNNNKLPIAPIAPVISVTPIAPIAPIVPVQPEVITIKAIAGNPISMTVNKPVNIAVPIGNVNVQKPVRPKENNMTADLQKDGLLKNMKNFKYTINESGFTINGVKQPESVHRKYMKYLKNKKGTTTVTVSSN